MSRFALAALGLAILLPAGAALAEPEPKAPVYETISVHGAEMDSLEGWTLEPKPWSHNRIVLRTGGYSSASVQTVKMPELDALTRAVDLEMAIGIALGAEGVRNVSLSRQREITGEAADVFRDVLDAPGGRFFAWIATGERADSQMKAAGFSIITAQGDSPGTGIDYFFATTEEYEHLGGAIVPMARYFEIGFSEPDPDVLAYGRQSDEKAVAVLAEQFEAFMLGIAMTQAQMGLLDQTSLSILQGLGQVVPYGLQDPMWDW
ncbi:MAG: hypothetical protein CME84_08095 [Henriciella sp.]|jgi:hypothetical protein|uniref:hypothetical protein n=1 Tax=Henriciella sp. TaxID=1968823 RepID=UPI000C0EB568|nr:hypothetical protein [Henriciella sp.]MAN74029.1 hypothetical protein [Henriciella sp.]MBF35242.1 hypothetical protein [Hyphomonadaceae bacterium]PHR81121.1 MAG: hypothetical protein COA64_03035 [Henriciella sp.]|tara:strand:- start:4024 stop:4809 length:786 start_codon:yes stop_codon:yes gene_type:complete